MAPASRGHLTPHLNAQKGNDQGHMKEIEPINPESDSYLDMERLHFHDSDAVVRDLAYTRENDTVTMKWRNATLIVRAGTAKAWIEIDRMADP